MDLEQPCRLFFFAVLIAFFMAGCATYRPALQLAVSTDYIVQLNRAYEALPNYTRVYFQDGMRVTANALDRWAPYCALYVFNRDKKADYLSSAKPGSFAISRVIPRVVTSRDPFPLNGQNQTSVIYASVGIGFGGGLAGGIDWQRDGPPSYYVYKLEMKLASADQPDVKTLTSSNKWGSPGDHYPTLIEIRRALGDLVSISPDTA